MAEQTAERKAVLLVDADVIVRHELAEYLRHCGHRVIEASSTDEAVVVLENAPNEVDVTLCDAAAAGARSAFEFATWVRQRGLAITVLLAGNPRKAAETAAELCDEGPLLARPYDPAVIIERIQRSRALRERERKSDQH
jgi:CheY-like chemotaxis protein